MRRARLLLFTYEVGSYLIPFGVVWAGVSLALRTIGRMNPLEAASFGFAMAFFAGLVGLTVFRRWGVRWVRLGPLRLDLRVGGWAIGVSPIDPWGVCRWYQLGDLIVVSREPETVVLRLTIPSYFAEGANGAFWENAVPLDDSFCLQRDHGDDRGGQRAVIIVATDAGAVDHLPTEMVIEPNGHLRGHADLIVEIGGDEITSEISKRWMAGSPGNDLTVVFEDLISGRKLSMPADDIPSIDAPPTPTRQSTPDTSAGQR